MDRFRQSLPGEVHVTSKRKHTLTVIGTNWPSNIFTGRSKADTLWTSNRQASKEQLKNMSTQLQTEISGAEMRERMGALENQA